MEKFNTHVLKNGLRIIHVPSPTNVAYCGIAIDAGTRDENESEHGIAHFCEHMMFKGTQKRKAWHILNRMELVGGDLNAYTNKEETVVYAAFLKEHLSRAVELISDVVFNSVFPAHEMEKEAEVVADEFESYNDSPSELIFDQFENLIYKGHPLGHNILGTPERVRAYTPADLLKFVNRLYTPQNTVFFVFGDFSFRQVVTVVERYCGKISREEQLSDVPRNTHGDVFHGNKWRMPLPEYIPQNLTEYRSTHQAHVMIGGRAYPAKDKRRIALYLLNNILGGPGMNSRLNVSLREHHGLVYNVESSLTNYTDTGTFGIYFGCDAKDIDKCLRLVRKELDRLMDKPLTQRQLQASINQIKGQIGVACDNFENYALDMAKVFLHYNKFESVDETFSLLSTLTPDALQQVAQEMFAPEKLSMIIYR